MKEIVEKMNTKNVVCKSLHVILPKEIGSRKKIEIYVGVNLKEFYCLVLKLKKKSRVLQKEAKELMLLHEKIESYKETKILKKYIWIDAPLCSKAKALLEEDAWKVWS